MFNITAKVQVKNGDKVLGDKEYSKVVFEGTGRNDKGEVIGQDNPEALLGDAIAYFQEQAGEKGNGVVELLKAATYANDLGVRAKIRQTIVAALEGPEKAIEKAVKDLMALRQSIGKPITEDDARKRVMAQMES